MSFGIQVTIEGLNRAAAAIDWPASFPKAQLVTDFFGRLV